MGRKALANYTTRLKSICEYYAEQNGVKNLNDVREVIKQSRKNIFDFYYPIFDESYRETLETNILLYYYMYEICAETVALWKVFLTSRMFGIMTYYNKLYESELLEYNPLEDTNIVTTHNKKNKGKNVRDLDATDNRDYKRTSVNQSRQEENIDASSSNTNTPNVYTLENDTPQNGIAGFSSLENLDYLTKLTKVTGSTGDNGSNNSERIYEDSYNESITDSDKSKSTADETITSNNKEDFTQKVTGKSSGASYNQLLKEYRENLLNIDMMIIDRLKDLFFLLY